MTNKNTDNKAPMWAAISSSAAFLTALITAATLIFAIYSFKQLQKAERALILPIDPQINFTPPNNAKITMFLKNFGSNPAENFQGMVKIFNAKKSNPKIYSLDIDMYVELPPGIKINWTKDLHSESNTAQHYVYLYMKYRDSVTDKSYDKPLYFYWKGSVDGKAVNEKLLLATKEHKDKMIEILKKSK